MQGEEEVERRLREAHRAHDSGRAVHLTLLDGALQAGLEAIRTAALINGGAVIAGIAFASDLRQALHGPAVDYFFPVLIFAAGALAAGLASGFGYFAQSAYAAGRAAMVFTWNHPFSEETSASRRWNVAGRILNSIAVLLVLGSYGCVVWGAWLAWKVAAGSG